MSLKRKRTTSSNKLPALDNFHINRLFQEALGLTSPCYTPCLTKDRLDTLPAMKTSMIINSADENNIKELDGKAHWCLLYVNDLYVILFDSYGSLPNQNTINYARRVAKKYKLMIVYNNSQYQELGSDACGYYCLYVLLHLLNGENYDDILKNFNDKQVRKNEKYLQQWFTTMKIGNKSLKTYLTEPL